MQHRSDFWRLSLFTALGLCPNACGGRTSDNSSTAAEVEGATTSEESESSADSGGTTTRPSPQTSSPRTTSAPTQPVSTTGTTAITTEPGVTSTTAPAPSTTTEPPRPGSSDGGVSSETRPQSDAGASTCGESMPFSLGDHPTGLSQCENGLRHRPSAAVECTSTVPRDEQFDTEGNLGGDCTSDADCGEAPYGFCDYADGQVPQMVCKYGCLTDADCAQDQLCVCGDPVGQCFDSNCKEDADCGEGFLCAYWGETTGIGCPVTPHYVCQTAEDECAVDEDCPQTDFGMRCSAAGGSRKCVEIEGVACGRPFLVEGAERLAALVHAGPYPGVRIGEELDAALRNILGKHWASIGLMEHASIAAFARFALQLMHVGAPHSLLVAAQRAMLDETEHAEVCFDIASRVFGHTVGAGELPMDQALSETSLQDILRLTIREGCIGETVAAMEAAEAAALAVDPHIKAALSKIQSDELRHAELAWRFVQWALQRDANGATPTLRVVLEEEISRAGGRQESSSVERTSSDVRLETYGVLSAEVRAALRREALRNVVFPCAAELLRATAPSPDVTDPAPRSAFV